MSYTQVYRSSTTRALGAVTVLICAAGLVTVGMRGNERELLRFGGPLLLVLWLAWVAYWRPHVRLDESGVTMHNVFRVVHVPWARVVEIHSRYGLRVDTEQGSYAAWAVAAPVGRDRLRGGDTEASLMTRQRLERLRGLGELTPGTGAPETQVRWDVPALATTAAVAAVALVGAARAAL